jgi:hypothetical protein
MNLEDPKIKAAFIRGYLNKQAEAGLEKSAFWGPLLGLLGSVGGQALGARFLTPKLVSMAEGQLAGRAAARAAARTGNQANPAWWSFGRRAAYDPGASSRLGRGYDNFLSHLVKPMGNPELTSRGAGAWAENIGLLGGGAVGTGIGTVMDSPQQNQQPYQA